MLSSGLTRIKKLLRIPAVLKQIYSAERGYKKWRFRNEWPVANGSDTQTEPPNPLRSFFESRREGRGIWKWKHYFDIYDRHLSRFRGREIRILEIGIYSGGSLDMWREYFGAQCRIYGVDIEPACKNYESDCVKVYIGDQADRNFWTRFKKEVPPFDIVIDDGGHRPEQQIVSIEELLPHLRPGGVYICEDVHGTLNSFAGYVSGFAHNLNTCERFHEDLEENERRLVFGATPFQSAIHSVHLYPFLVAIERTGTPISELVAAKHGTQWQPFLA
jgi:hypothetical protein